MQATVEQAIEEMVRAWNSGDAGEYAAQFTEDATYVIFAGAASLGRAAIHRDHVPVLTKWQRGSRMRVSVVSVRYLDDRTAVVLSEGGVSKKASIPLDKTQTLVMRRQDDGRWLCAAFQNTKKHRLMAWFSQRSARGGDPVQEQVVT